MLYGFYWKRRSEKETRTNAQKELKENEMKAEIPSFRLELCRMMF
jgi:hypothetical protein